MALTKVEAPSTTPEYQAYYDAKGRCENKKAQGYPYYGGRGIEFKFSSFEEFMDVLGERPDGMSLDRIDVDGHYEPSNVRWADWSTQMRNRRSHDMPWMEGNSYNAKQYIITHPDGKVEEIFNMAEFCRNHGLDKANLQSTANPNKPHSKTHKGYKAQFKEVA